MVDTWRDSWFEEGARLIYIVPRATIDDVLPLDITPSASRVERVFVGRIELITPATESAVRDAIETRDVALLQKYARFVDPIVARVFPMRSFDVASRVQAAVKPVYASWAAPACR